MAVLKAKTFCQIKEKPKFECLKKYMEKITHTIATYNFEVKCIKNVIEACIHTHLCTTSGCHA